MKYEEIEAVEDDKKIVADKKTGLSEIQILLGRYRLPYTKNVVFITIIHYCNWINILSLIFNQSISSAYAQTNIASIYNLILYYYTKVHVLDYAQLPCLCCILRLVIS